MASDNFILINEKFKEGIMLDKYQNEYGLCMAQEGEDGKKYLRWVFPQGKNREPGKKAIPMRITLGVKQQAIQRLEQLLMMIEKG